MTASFLEDFNAAWPAFAIDDPGRVARAAGRLSETDRLAALAGVAPFFAHLKRTNRKHVPAGWRYLEEKRWELLPLGVAPRSELCAGLAIEGLEPLSRHRDASNRHAGIIQAVTSLRARLAEDEADQPAVIGLEDIDMIAVELGSTFRHLVKLVDRWRIGLREAVHSNSPSSAGIAAPMIAEPGAASLSVPGSASDPHSGGASSAGCGCPPACNPPMPSVPAATRAAGGRHA
jgi:hypothetical protein